MVFCNILNDKMFPLNSGFRLSWLRRLAAWMLMANAALCLPSRVEGGTADSLIHPAHPRQAQGEDLARCSGAVQRVDPPCWWVGMFERKVQLLLYTTLSKEAQWRLAPGSKGVSLQGVRHAAHGYVWMDLDIGPEASPGGVGVQMRLSPQDSWQEVVLFPLHQRTSGDFKGAGVHGGDLVYLIMPDRFANGNPDNDRVTGMRETAVNRGQDVARHGGDLQGVLEHLDYLQGLGVTALWLNPVLENDLPRESYHGYAATDLYKVDPRLGDHELYRSLVQAAAKRGMKVLMDVVHNHWGSTHPLLARPADPDWVHGWPEFTRSNYRAMTRMDPYGQPEDKDLMRKGWFDHPMPDLDQTRPDLARYMTQNNLWWVEYCGLAGFRIDTYAYPDTKFMRQWTKSMVQQYPKLAMLGEVWVHTVPESAYWTDSCMLFAEADSVRLAGPGLPSVTDFPLRISMVEGLREPFGWDHGLRRIYYTLAQDFLYKNPYRNLIFLDNHDVSRAWAEFGQDTDKVEMAYKMLYTLRGIPQVYYGSEVLMGNFSTVGGTNVRQDMPGGWPGDKVSVFEGRGLSGSQQWMLDFLRRMGRWRKESPVLQEGRLDHYVPEDEVYVYFRTQRRHRMMVLVNASSQQKTVKRTRYARHWPQGVKALAQPEGVPVLLGEALDLPSMSCTVLEWEGE